MLDKKLLRKALEQAEAMAQVARQMAARGAPVPLMPETVFSKQVGCTPLHTLQERLDRGRRAPRRTSGGRRGRGGCLRAVGRGTRARATHSHPHPHPHPRPNGKRVASSLSLCAAQMEVQLFDGGRVVQTKPAIGSAQKVRHTFIPPAMLPVVRAFMALPGAATFTLDQLHAPDAFLKVCTVRQLMALHALVFLGEEESKRWRRRRDFDIREPDR